MKKLLIGMFSILCLTNVNAQDNFKSEFDEFRTESMKEFNDFRKDCFAEYIDFVRQAWAEVGVERPIPLPEDEVFVPEINNDADPETNSWLSRQLGTLKTKILGVFSSKKKKETPADADAMPENLKSEKKQQEVANAKPGKGNDAVEALYERIRAPKDPYQQPQPLSPVQEDKSSLNDYYTFKSFGTEYKVRMGDNCRFNLEYVGSNAIADALKNMLHTQFDNILFDCLKLREEHHLSDWAYYQMLCDLVDSFYGKETNEANLVLAFLYMQSGYKIRMGHDREHVFVLLASKHRITGKPYYKLGDDNFYPMRGKSPDRMSICDVPFQKEMGLSLIIPDIQDFAFEATEPRTISSLRYPEFSFTISLNKNLIDFYNTYPSSTLGTDDMTRWAMYANAPIVEEVKNQLYSQMSAKLQGLSERESVARLLNWVQTGFDYKFDNEVWGCDRPFFGEESLFYPYCDCEDRAILLSHLVRDLVGLKTALVYVPGHLAMAVEFNEDVDGCYFVVDGRRFVFCDPTYVVSNIGEYSPQTQIDKAQLYLLEKEI